MADRLTIACYPAESRAISRVLRIVRSGGSAFEVELTATGSTNEMLELLRSARADIALFTLPDDMIHLLDAEAIQYEATNLFSISAITRTDRFPGHTRLSKKELSAFREIVTYGGTTVGSHLIESVFGPSKRSKRQVHGAPDTKTIVDLLKEGVGEVGIAVSKVSKTDLGDGFSSYPLSPLMPWRSYVAIRREVYTSSSSEGRRFFEALTEYDRAHEPGWLTGHSPIPGIHPYAPGLLQEFHGKVTDIILEELDRELLESPRYRRQASGWFTVCIGAIGGLLTLLTASQASPVLFLAVELLVAVSGAATLIYQAVDRANRSNLEHQRAARRIEVQEMMALRDRITAELARHNH